MKIMQLLHKRGAKVAFHDPYVEEVALNGSTVRSVQLTTAAVEHADLVAVLTPHSAYDLDWVAEHAKLRVRREERVRARPPGPRGAAVSAVFERSPLVLSRRVGASWLVTTPDDPEVHELQGGAAIVWERLHGPTSIDALTEGLLAAGVTAPDSAPR